MLGHEAQCYNFFLYYICLQNILKVPKKSKVILTKSTFWRTPKRHVSPTFSEMSLSDVGCNDNDSDTA